MNQERYTPKILNISCMVNYPFYVKIFFHNINFPAFCDNFKNMYKNWLNRIGIPLFVCFKDAFASLNLNKIWKIPPLYYVIILFAYKWKFSK